MLIGLAGAAGSGKGSVAEFLARGPYIFTEIAFADPVYAAVAAITGIPVPRLKDRGLKERAIPGLGRSPRELLQLLGTEFGRRMVCESIWVDRAMQTVDYHSSMGMNTVIADVRFDNEAEAIRGRGGMVWEVLRAGPSCLAGGAAGHASEEGISRDLVDLVVFNDGTLDDLRANVDAAIREATELYN